MLPIPADIFTEPTNVSPDTLANLGPLRGLAGLWQADKGVDINPKAEGPERRVFIEHVRMDPIDAQANGPQLFYGLQLSHPYQHARGRRHLPRPGRLLAVGAGDRPHHADRRHSARPVLLAAGHAKPDDRKISVAAKRGDTKYGICSTEFLDEAFRTDSYRIDITFNDDDSWTYLVQTELFVHGKPFNHHDTNTLKRAAGPTANPLAAILSQRAAKP